MIPPVFHGTVESCFHLLDNQGLWDYFPKLLLDCVSDVLSWPVSSEFLFKLQHSSGPSPKLFVLASANFLRYAFQRALILSKNRIFHPLFQQNREMMSITSLIFTFFSCGSSCCIAWATQESKWCSMTIFSTPLSAATTADNWVSRSMQ